MNRNNAVRESVILAALLHDIGKVVQRAQSNPRQKRHPQWGSEWFERKDGLRGKPRLAEILDADELKLIDSAISSHHADVEFVTLADSISAGERSPAAGADKEEKDPSTTPLISIFCRLGPSDKRPRDRYYPVRALSGTFEECFPVEEPCNPLDYARLLEGLNGEISALDFKGWSARRTTELVTALLQKYLWAVPSSTYKDEPDVSLFDHAKTTAALALCLYDYQGQDPKRSPTVETPAFRLVAGDVSGIQPYLFDVLGQQGRVAKRLRGRSFFIQMVSEIAAHKILRAFDLPTLNILTAAGGNFYILVPNREDTELRLLELQEYFDRWGLEEMNGQLAVNLASIETTGGDIMEFTGVLEKLKERVALVKGQPFKLALTSGKGWECERFIRPDVIEGDERACKGCHHHPAEEESEEQFCRRCEQDILLGKRLPKAKFLAFFTEAGSSSSRFDVFDHSVELLDKYRDRPEAYLVCALNSPNETTRGIGFRFLAAHVPLDAEGNPLSFEIIVKKATGDRLLGYVRGDVDDLGKVLGEAFPTMTVSRFCNFSRMMDGFFSGFLDHKLSTDFPDMYTVFSGGDDFILVGPWDKTFKAAGEIRRDFDRYVGTNARMTFSAGVFLAAHHEPVSHCMETVQIALAIAKDASEKKNRITLFGKPVTWEELKAVQEHASQVQEWLQGGVLSRGFVANLCRYGEMAERYADTGKTAFLEYVPRMTRDINRNLTRREHGPVRDWLAQYLPTAGGAPQKEPSGLLRLVAQFALLLTRS